METPFRAMQGSWPITNQRPRVCLYFPPGCWVANLDPRQTDSPCRSPPDIWFPHCFDHKRRRTLLCPCLRRPPRRSSRLWNNRQWRSWKNKWKPSGRPERATQQASIPTWGQIKSLCHSTRNSFSAGILSLSWKGFYCYACLLSCQASATSSTSEKYWAYFPDPPTFQVVTWNSDPIRGQHRPASSLGRILYFLW